MIPILVMRSSLKSDARADPNAKVEPVVADASAFPIFYRHPVTCKVEQAVDWCPGENTEDVFEELAWEMLMADVKRYAP